MSFGDISSYNSNQRTMNDSVGVDGLTPIKTKLSQFQRLCAAIKDLITEMRRRKVNQAEKTQYVNITFMRFVSVCYVGSSFSF